MQAVLLSSDLMLVSAAQGAADRHDVVLRVAGSTGDALALCGDSLTALLIVDLRLPRLDIGQLVDGVREGAEGVVQIVACGPHVHEQSLAAAREAGCDAVITRGEFDRRIDGYFEPLTPPSAAPRRPR